MAAEIPSNARNSFEVKLLQSAINAQIAHYRESPPNGRLRARYSFSEAYKLAIFTRKAAVLLYMFENTEIVLVVDDELSDREAMQEILQEHGYTVWEARDYQQALTVFAQCEREIDLLVTDISLPGNNGCDLAKAMLRLKPHLKVLFISGHAGAEICRYYGIPKSDLHFMRKPFKPADLLSRVRAVLNSMEPFFELPITGDDAGDGDTSKQY